MKDEFARVPDGEYFFSEASQDFSNWTTGAFHKRLFDLLFSVSMMVGFAPLFFTIVILLKFMDNGPVIFAHKRIGKNGREFKCYKFRTMIMDADKVLEAVLKDSPEMRLEWLATRKLKDDPRIVPGIGHILRSSSLDELPQIFNVMFGDMSVVGPRPIVKDELKYYGAQRVAYLSVRPGLTGPWQAGARSDTSYDERVALDLDYIRTGSLRRDLSIVAKTVWKLLSFNQRGAY